MKNAVDDDIDIHRYRGPKKPDMPNERQTSLFSVFLY